MPSMIGQISPRQLISMLRAEFQVPDSGAGIPAYNAPEGTLYWDITNDNLYVNEDGTNNWQIIGGAGSISGGGANTQVTYWTAPSVIAGDAGFTYDAATDTITLAGGITLTGSANAVITVNDNVANAMTVVDAGGVEYMRVISTDAQPVVRFNDGGADVDFYVEAVGVADALFIRGSDGQVTLGALGAGLVQSDAGGVLSSSYIIGALVTFNAGWVLGGGTADLDGNDLIIDADGDSYLHASADDVVQLVLATASGEFDININGANDFTFTANSFNVASGSDITMADDTTIGLSAGGNIQFDATPAPDQAILNSLDLNINGNDFYIPDNTADAFTWYDSGGINYMRIISTDTQPIIRFNDGGADVDFYVEAFITPDAFIVRGSDGQITLGALGAGFVQSDAGGVLSSAAIVAGDVPHSVLDGAYHTDTVAAGPLRGSLIYGDATPEWNRLAHPAAATRLLTTDANDTLWTTYNVVGTAAQTYTFGTAGGTITTSAGTLTAATANNVTAAGVQTHAITTTSDGDTTPSTILAADANGRLRLDGLGINVAPGGTELTIDADINFIGAQSITTSAGNLTINAFGDTNITSTAGVGLARTDGTLHVHTASAGAVTAPATADDLVVEVGGAGGGVVLTPDANPGYWAMGSPSDSLGAYTRWQHSTAIMRLATANASGVIDIMTANESRAIRIDASQQTIFGGGVSPDGTVHVQTASAGAVTAAAAADDLTIENSGAGGISILVPDANDASLYFGSPTDSIGASITWNHDGDLFAIGSANAGANVDILSGNAVRAIRIESDQDVIFGGSTVPTAQVHIEQPSTTIAQPVLLLDQSDVDHNFIYFIGTAAAGTLTNNIVDEGDQSSETREGWLMIYVQDDGAQVTDQVYFVPFYSLS